MLRLIDANLNRAREGIRVIESVARFILNDADLSKSLKAMRHELSTDGYHLPEQVIAARRSGAKDAGYRPE